MAAVFPLSHTLVYYFEVVFAEFQRGENFLKSRKRFTLVFIIPFNLGFKKKKDKKTGRKKNKEMRCGKRS